MIRPLASRIMIVTPVPVVRDIVGTLLFATIWVVLSHPSTGTLLDIVFCIGVAAFLIIFGAVYMTLCGIALVAIGTTGAIGVLILNRSKMDGFCTVDSHYFSIGMIASIPAWANVENSRERRSMSDRMRLVALCSVCGKRDFIEKYLYTSLD